MKKTITIIITLILVLAACQKKAVPVITERKTEPPKIINSQYPPKETVAPDTLAGKRIFISRCGRCHTLPVMKQFGVERWDDILSVMFPRARLNNEEALHVWKYVLANAAK
jgi:hypothetical protein